MWSIKTSIETMPIKMTGKIGVDLLTNYHDNSVIMISSRTSVTGIVEC